jgi:predicted nucleotidyltransferase
MKILDKYRKAVDEFVERVLDKYSDRIDSIILFGSVARGEAKEIFCCKQEKTFL